MKRSAQNLLKLASWAAVFSFVGISYAAQDNLFLRSGATDCIYLGTSGQTLQTSRGTNQAAIAFSAPTNTFVFYSAPLTGSVTIASSKTANGAIGVQNNSAANFQFNASDVLYDYNPVTGSKTQIVACPASGWMTVKKNGASRATLPTTAVGGSGYTMVAGHMLMAVVTVTVNASSGINGALIYNINRGAGLSLIHFPRDNSLNWPFGSFKTTPNATITVPASVAANSTGNVASVLDAGTGATYFWMITNATITAGQSTRQITWTAGSSGQVGFGVLIVNGCSSAGSATTVVINAKTNQTITFSSIPTHTYGNSSFTLSATASSGLPVTFSIVSGPASVSGNTLSITGAGNVVVNATQAGNANYNPAVAQQSFTVNPATLTVSGVTASDKVYDGTTDATLNLGSAALVGVISGDSVTLDTSLAQGNFADANVGTGKMVSISGLDITGSSVGNYSLVQPATTASITAAGLTVSGVAVNDKVYDGTTAATLNTANAALVGVISGDAVTLNTVGAAASFPDKNVGSSKTVTIIGLGLSGASAGNYTLTQPAATANITPASLIVSATAADKVYDGTTTAAVTLSDNRIAGDSLTTAYAAANFSDKNVGGNKTVTVTGISVSGVDAGNYTFNTTATTTAKIMPLALSVTANAANKAYDGTTAATISASALHTVMTPDAVGLSDGTANFCDSKPGNGKTVTITGLSLTGPNAGNYVLASTTATTTANISVPQAPKIAHLLMAADHCTHISCSGTPGLTYIVQATTSLANPNWVNIETNTIASTGSCTNLDAGASGVRVRYYRTVVSY